MNNQIIEFLNQIPTDDNLKKLVINYLKETKKETDPKIEDIFLNIARLLLENQRLQLHEQELKKLIETIEKGEKEIGRLDEGLSNLHVASDPPQI
ncbi:hypothetical protein HYV31_00925 [candidate division WWE3 bacterium]|nr:hypothetical protein [candidate division WWE3 bacterium]